jgi:serine/threonine protein phosphatase PrpC
MKQSIIETAAGNPENQDRGLVIHDGQRIVLCVADGAGGRSGGTEAATLAVEFVQSHAAHTNDEASCADLLKRLDVVVAADTAAGETTCVIAVLAPDRIYGASVGDSGAWLVPESGPYVDLTRGQRRKPFIGTGDAWPLPFSFPRAAARILLATDGLLKYATGERITAVCREHPNNIAALRLIEMVRYPSGALPDDVTVILAELGTTH